MLVLICNIILFNFCIHCISVECAVIDEIQMLKDPQRGWAWTRALLGVVADEVHVCGEPAAVELVRSILNTTGEELEVREYKRLTALNVEANALSTLKNVRPGDCIVCFSKNDIYSVSRQIERLGHEVAVIYGGLPPGTKLAQGKNLQHSLDILGYNMKKSIFYLSIKNLFDKISIF